MLASSLPLKGFVLTTGGNHGQTDSVTLTMGVTNLSISRHFDTKIIQLAKELGGLNGHVPISVMFALAGVLLAVLTKSKYVAVGNEAAASIPNLYWNGKEINHQWSKSLEFEKLFQTYVEKNISPEICYFSAIRHLSSIAVTKIFSNHPEYFGEFTSCNKVFRIDPANRPNGRWCGQCDKCLSSFILFAPWLSKEQLISIFDENLLDKSSLKDSFLALLEIKGHKPLDCVGTTEEIRSSTHEIIKNGEYRGSALLELPEVSHLPSAPDINSFLEPSDEHALPKILESKLIKASKASSKHTFDLSAFRGKDVVCIGKAREGKSLQSFLLSNAPVNSFSFVDEKDDPNYLENLKKLDLDKTIVFKSAGVPGRLVPVPYTTHMNLFFSLARSLGVTLIGITGTKGKTTTSAMIHHILKENGKKTVLCGNIGIPALDMIDKIDDQTLVVVELGAYHCADLELSPGVAVYTNLDNDHLPYFGSQQAYQAAKQNMLVGADHGTKVILPQNEPNILDWAKQKHAKIIAVDIDQDASINSSKIIGRHNIHNALLASTVAEQFGIEPSLSFKALETFEPLDHRLQKITNIKGKTFIDDAIGSTPEATIAGISAVSESIGQIGVIMLGGEDRSYDYRDLVDKLAEANIPALILFPDTGRQIADLLPKNYSPDILETESMQEAVNWAYDKAPKNSVILLSTAAPSYSLWPGGFEEKGRAFQDAVRSLKV